jgi:ribosomal-protein-alanine N-acetyltransferase
VSEAAAPEKAFRLRRMILPDLPEVLAIERRSFPNPWPESTFRGELQNAGISHPLVAVKPESGEILGYLIYWKIADEAQVNNLAVHPDFRNRRIGVEMLREVLATLSREDVRLVTLEVRRSNAPARRLYEKLGFKVMGIRKAYYSNPVEDALVLGLTLN